MRVRWGSVTSDPFLVTNGVRQGGILSPFLFNMYMNDLSLILNASGTGCRIGDSLINHLMYADDLIIFSPYIVRQIGASIHKNCGFIRTSMKFGTVIYNSLMNNSRYGATAKTSYGSHGGHFIKWQFWPQICFTRRHKCFIMFLWNYSRYTYSAIITITKWSQLQGLSLIFQNGGIPPLRAPHRGNF